MPPDDGRVMMAHCATAVAMVAATSALMDKLSWGLDDFELEIIEVATAFVISATVVVLIVSVGL